MINFMKYRWLYVVLSLVIIVPGLFTVVTRGLKLGVDFTGGTLLEMRIDTPDKDQGTEKARSIVEYQQIGIGSIQTSGEHTYLFKLPTLEKDQYDKLRTAFSSEFGNWTEVRYETVGPTLGAELLKKTFIASLVAISGILLYVAWAFKNVRYGISAIIALVHDVLVVISIFALLGQWKGVEVDSLFVTAVLTTMSFSVHDTIVVFDRIRELIKKQGNHSFEHTVNQALTETMTRSLNNSLTIIFMLLALVLLGGDSIRWFAVALLVGTITGTYSSPFVATPVLYSLSKNKQYG